LGTCMRKTNDFNTYGPNFLTDHNELGQNYIRICDKETVARVCARTGKEVARKIQKMYGRDPQRNQTNPRANPAKVAHQVPAGHLSHITPNTASMPMYLFGIQIVTRDTYGSIVEVRHGVFDSCLLISLVYPLSSLKRDMSGI